MSTKPKKPQGVDGDGVSTKPSDETPTFPVACIKYSPPTNKKPSDATEAERISSIFLGLMNMGNLNDDIGRGEPCPIYNDLVEAAYEQRWDLIVAAVKKAHHYLSPANDMGRIKEETKSLAWFLAKKYGFNKGEIIDFMEACHPEHFKALPKSKRLISDWWKKTTVIEQSRGYAKPVMKASFKVIVQKTLEVKRNGEGDPIQPSWMRYHMWVIPD